ncbi:putative PurR-regulated permease PerM [Janthinobacterium sp. CG_23.4]|nr:putative PurR-regulated permease PerM [Janthinobacterium sp. CG_23.4]
MPIEPKNAPPEPLTASSSEPAGPPPGTPGEHLDPSLRLPLHVNARGLALGTIATVSFIYALQWAQKFLIPVIFSIFIAYTLNRVVAWLEKLRLPRAVGVTVVMALILFGSLVVVERVQGEFESIVEALPAATQKLSRLIATSTGGKSSTLQKMRVVANEIEQVAAGAEARRNNRRAAAAEAPNFKIMDWVWAGSLGLVGFLSQASIVIFLVFFLLLSGDTFKRKLVKLTGPSLSRKKVTVHILEDINTSIQNYMFMLLVTNVLLAVLMWIALRVIGLENAGAWAIVAGLLHIMPYFGPLLITIATGLVAFLQFESLEMVLLVTGTSMAIATLVGTFVTTWMTGRIARMNPAAVFISLLFWGWLWGVWGLLLGVPIIVIVKVVAERVEGMEVVAELLGE